MCTLIKGLHLNELSVTEKKNIYNTNKINIKRWENVIVAFGDEKKRSTVIISTYNLTINEKRSLNLGGPNRSVKDRSI